MTESRNRTAHFKYHTKKLFEFNWEILSPVYSSDIAVSDYHLFFAKQFGRKKI